MKQQDLRTPDQKFDDLLADDTSFDEIAYRLGWTMGQVRTQYLKVCKQMGVRPDEE